MRKTKTISGRNGKVKIMLMTTIPFSAIFITLSVFCFIYSYIVMGIVLLLVLFLSIAGVIHMAGQKVVFYEEYLQIPKTYVMLNVPFSKTIIPYNEIASIEYIEPRNSGSDCVDHNGKKTGCIKFTDKLNNIYRMKTEYFSKKQIQLIIEEANFRANL